MRETTAPRTHARLTTFVYRAAGDLGAAAKNARTDAERTHFEQGRELCRVAFTALTNRKARA